MRLPAKQALECPPSPVMMKETSILHNAEKSKGGVEAINEEMGKWVEEAREPTLSLQLTEIEKDSS